MYLYFVPSAIPPVLIILLVETIAQIVTVSVAILIASGYLAYGAKRHIARVAIIQLVLTEIRYLTLKHSIRGPAKQGFLC